MPKIPTELSFSALNKAIIRANKSIDRLDGSTGNRANGFIDAEEIPVQPEIVDDPSTKFGRTLLFNREFANLTRTLLDLEEADGRPLTTAVFKSQLETVFTSGLKRIDKNGNNKISQKELYTAFKTIGSPLNNRIWGTIAESIFQLAQYNR